MARNPLYTLVSFQIRNEDADLYRRAAAIEGIGTERLSGTPNVSEWIRQTLRQHARKVINDAGDNTPKVTNNQNTVDPPTICPTDRDREQPSGSTVQVVQTPKLKTKGGSQAGSKKQRFSEQLFRLVLPDGATGKRMTKKLLGQLAAEGNTSIENLLQTFRNHPEFEPVPGKPESENWWRVRKRRTSLRNSATGKRRMDRR